MGVPSSKSLPRPEPDEAARVLSAAFLRAAAALGLSRGIQAKLLGVSEASLSRLAHQQRRIDPDSKEGELALLLLRAFRSLDSLVGGDDGKARAWLHADNAHLGGTPAALITSVRGLVQVGEYLDAIRGKL